VEESGRPHLANKETEHIGCFWGDRKKVYQPMIVVGISKDTGEETIVFEANEIEGFSYYGTSRALPVRMMLPSLGLWKVEIYFGEQLFGDVGINVKEEG
jgi:hypothetical protein